MTSSTLLSFETAKKNVDYLIKPPQIAQRLYIQQTVTQIKQILVCIDQALEPVMPAMILATVPILIPSETRSSLLNKRSVATSSMSLSCNH